MTARIGTLGRMVEFKCPVSEDVSYTPRSSYKETLGGRVVEQRGPRPRRTWNVQISTATPQEVAGLESLFLGEYGDGAWIFQPPDALSVNMLTPAVSLLQAGFYQSPGAVGGPSLASDSFWVPQTITVPASSQVYLGESEGGFRWGAPVKPGETYTASMYGSGAGATFSMIFRNASLATVGSAVSAPMSGSLTRHSVTAVAPSDAVEVLLRINTIGTPARFGAPAVSLGSSTVGWGVGRAARKASVSEFQKQISFAVPGDSFLNRESPSLTVREVG